jgi:hypothetical protein
MTTPSSGGQGTTSVDGRLDAWLGPETTIHFKKIAQGLHGFGPALDAAARIALSRDGLPAPRHRSSSGGGFQQPRR